MKQLDKEKLPKHIAIIMDGNGRWAKKRFLNRIAGHQKGADAVKETVRTCRELGIEVLTLFAFSTENWSRPADEVEALMNFLRRYLLKERDEMLTNEIQLNAIGAIENLPHDVYSVLMDTIKSTENCKGMILNLALSYGGRGDILNALRKIINDYEYGKVKPEGINEEVFSHYLYTAGIPDPDLLIRTSGEYRISNFLLWQMAYTEIYITDTLWPDFKEKDLFKAIIDFQSRERRFGLTSEQAGT
ncbi:MAG: isoprenyl transferase [Thermodesulfobacteriota bacterium]|nr:isoprenyl transferase [Thermodesulfobacteriota bacterium]